jgi:hypothetical protein
MARYKEDVPIVTGPLGPVTTPAGAGGGPSWGLVPQPLAEEPDRSSLHGSLLVVVVMFGWLLLVVGMGAVVARNDPNVETPVEVNLGVVVTPADGWYPASDWNVGENGVGFQKSGVGVAFWVNAFQGSTEQLMASVLEEFRGQWDSFRDLPASRVAVASGLPALLVHFTGGTDWGQEENEVMALSYGSLSVVMLVEAPSGALEWVQGDVDTMLETLQVPR